MGSEGGPTAGQWRELLRGPGTALRRSPPSTRATRHDPPHLLLEHGALDSLSPGRGATGLGCSRLDPGEASHRRLPVAVAALPPRSSAGRRCLSSAMAGGSSAVLGSPSVSGPGRRSPTLGASVARLLLATRHLSGFPWGPPTQDTGRCSIVYWRADGSG